MPSYTCVARACRSVWLLPRHLPSCRGTYPAVVALTQMPWHLPSCRGTSPAAELRSRTVTSRWYLTHDGCGDICVLCSLAAFHACCYCYAVTCLFSAFLATHVPLASMQPCSGLTYFGNSRGSRHSCLL